MPNPYHDTEGRFTSKEGMQAAAHELITEGKFHEAIQLLTEYENASGESSSLSEREPVRDILASGKVEYRLDGKLHRLDGPARIYPDGTQQWYQNGELHRVDGPAITNPNGKEFWYQNDKLHREDGPALIHPDGTEEWYQNGERHRVDGPAVTTLKGHEFWYVNGKPDRVDGPALTYPNGTKEWRQGGELHRVDGPAIIQPDGSEEYWVNGQKISKARMVSSGLLVVPLNESQEKALTRLLKEKQDSDSILLGDLARDVCGMQSQYIARYVAGYLPDDQTPTLSKGLTITGVESGDYHSFRIRKDDAAIFAQRVLTYRSNR